MRVPATTASGPVATMTPDQIDTEFSHIIRTNFSGQLKRPYIPPTVRLTALI